MHFISRKQLKRTDFPTLLFFVKGEMRFVRWFRLKELLLLITRVFLLLLLILAAANLKIPFKFFNRSEVLIVDGSPSMEKFEFGQKNAFIVPTISGIPQFSYYLKKHPVGILITDVQRNGFSEIIKKGEKFPGIRVKRENFPAGNLGIVAASSSPAFEGEKFVINFKILNEYKKNKKTILLLKARDRIIKEENVILKVGDNLMSFDIRLPKGIFAFSLELEDKEGFLFDNKFYFVVNVHEKRNIYVLSDSFPARLMAALSHSYFRVKWGRELADVNGDLFIACGMSEKDISGLLQSAIPGIVCVQGKTNTLISNKISNKISTVIERSVFDRLLCPEGLSEIPVRYNCLITEGTGFLYFENGDPFLNRIKNHLILPISLEKNDLSLHPVFIPFLFGLIDFLSDEMIHSSNIRMDEEITIESSFKPGIIDPEGITYKPTQVGQNIYVFTETKECGFYKINDGKTVRGLVAVNTHPTESKIESLSEEEIIFVFGKQDLFNGVNFFLVIAFLCFVLSVFLERKIFRIK